MLKTNSMSSKTKPGNVLYLKNNLQQWQKMYRHKIIFDFAF